MYKCTAPRPAALSAFGLQVNSNPFLRADTRPRRDAGPMTAPHRLNASIPPPVALDAASHGTANCHPIAGTVTSSFSLPESPPRVQPPCGVRSGIPRLDDFFAGGFTGGRIALLEGPAEFIQHLSSCFAVSGVASCGRAVVFIDGGNTADPYGLAAVCRRWHLDPREVLGQIFIARAFTVYQLDAMFSRMVQEKLSELNPGVLMVSALNSMYLDPDVNWDEARVIFQNDMRMLRSLTEKYNVITIITNHGGHKSYHAMELSRTLRRMVGLYIDVRARSKHVLRLVRNGAETMDYRPLPPYQCSLDEFSQGGMFNG